MRIHWMIGMAMAAGLQAHGQDCRVAVYVLAGVPVPAGMLGDAEKKATRMFAEIGVNLHMRDGIPRHFPDDACGAPIVIQVDDAVGYPGHAEALAYASPYQDSGTCIHVFARRVIGMSREPGFANTLLAHVMVHEITHVLEQVTRHSEDGIMKAAWSSRDYEWMKRQSLPFAQEDVRLIKDGLARRRDALEC